MPENTLSSWRRYTSVAVVLHWLIAALIVALIAIGWWMTDAIKDPQTQGAAGAAYQLHKSLGLTVLVLSVLRLIWRILHPAPPLPAEMGALERAGAHLSHWGFYGLMLAVPLSGWALVSWSPHNIPTFYFWIFEVPHLPAVPMVGLEHGAASEAAAHQAHEWLVYLTLLLLALHVSAALKHHYIDGDAVLARMVPWVKPRAAVAEPFSPPSAFTAPRILGAAFVALAAGAGGVLVAQQGASVLKASAAAPEMSMAVEAQVWTPVMERSSLGFSGAKSGAPFEGKFENWKAAVAFSEEALESSKARIWVDLTSARLSDPMDEATLQGPEWFETDVHPSAEFVTTSFAKGDAAGAYLAQGVLTLRGIDKPLELPFTLKIHDDQATAMGEISIDRGDFGVGVNSMSHDFVSQEIKIIFTLTATR